MSHNKGTLLNGVIRLKLLNNHFTFSSLINLDFLPTDTKNFDDSIALLFSVFEPLEFILSVFFLHLKQYVNMFYNLELMYIIFLEEINFIQPQLKHLISEYFAII